jgi:hypothetical protein
MRWCVCHGRLVSIFARRQGVHSFPLERPESPRSYSDEGFGRS